MPGRDERGNGTLGPSARTQPREHAHATKKAPGKAGAPEAGLSPQPTSELLLPEPHPHQPGLGLLDRPAVIGFQDVSDADHQVKSPAVVGAASEGIALQGLAELQEIELRQPVALLKGGEGMLLLEGIGLRGNSGRSWRASTGVLQQGSQDGESALKEGEQGQGSEAQ